MTALDVFRAIGAAGDDLLARSETRPARRRRWVLLAAALLALLAAACAIAAHYRLVPWFGVVESSAEIYTNAAPVEFDTPDGPATAHVLAAENTLTVLLHSPAVTGGQAASSLNARGDLSQEGSLRLAGTDYPPVSVSRTATSASREWVYTFPACRGGREWVYTFAVPAADLRAGQTLRLTLWWLDAPVTFRLAAAQSIEALSDVGSFAESAAFDLAVQSQQTDTGLALQLYHVNRTGMEFVSYGKGGGYGMVEPSLGGFRLLAGGQESASEGEDSVLTFPHSFSFPVTNPQGAVLCVPYVILRDRADIHLEQAFASRDEALAWQEDVTLPYCILHFFIEQGADERLRLTCTVSRTSKQYRLVGLGRPDDEIGFILTDEGDEGPVTSSLVSKSQLTETLRFSLDIPTVTYALITDFSIPLG